MVVMIRSTLLHGVHPIRSVITSSHPQVIRQTRWTAEEVKDFRALFDILDMNRSGVLEVSDVCSIFRARGITRSPEEVPRICFRITSVQGAYCRTAEMTCRTYSDHICSDPA